MTPQHMSPDNIPAQIRLHRELHGLTQQSLAAAAGVSKCSVTRYETRAREPKISAVFQLASALGVTVDKLLERPCH